MLHAHLVGIASTDPEQRVQPPPHLAPARQIRLEERLGIIPIIPRLGHAGQERRLDRIAKPQQPRARHHMPAPGLHVRSAWRARRHIQQMLDRRARHRRRQERPQRPPRRDRRVHLRPGPIIQHAVQSPLQTTSQRLAWPPRQGQPPAARKRRHCRALPRGRSGVAGRRISL